jgi:hypothetical protein
VTRLAAAALAALLATGCGGLTFVPRGELRAPEMEAPSAGVHEVPVCGYPVDLELRPEAGAFFARKVSGELLAVGPAGIQVAGPEGLLLIDRDAVARIDLHVLPSHLALAAVETVVGSALSLTNGYYLALSLPVWLGTAIALPFSRGIQGVVQAPIVDELLAPYARFPQGLPPGWPRPGRGATPCVPVPVEGATVPGAEATGPAAD